LGDIWLCWLLAWSLGTARVLAEQVFIALHNHGVYLLAGFNQSQTVWAKCLRSLSLTGDGGCECVVVTLRNSKAVVRDLMPRRKGGRDRGSGQAESEPPLRWWCFPRVKRRSKAEQQRLGICLQVILVAIPVQDDDNKEEQKKAVGSVVKVSGLAVRSLNVGNPLQDPCRTILVRTHPANARRSSCYGVITVVHHGLRTADHDWSAPVITQSDEPYS
jgi:hypothetical protein